MKLNHTDLVNALNNKMNDDSVNTHNQLSNLIDQFDRVSGHYLGLATMYDSGEEPHNTESLKELMADLIDIHLNICKGLNS